MDTSHVSVVTVGDESIQVKDSGSTYGGSGNHLLGSTSDLSHSSSGKCSSSKSESGDEVRGTSIILDGATRSATMDDIAGSAARKMNGQIGKSSSRDELYKKNNLNGKVYTDSCDCGVVSVYDSRLVNFLLSFLSFRQFCGS